MVEFEELTKTSDGIPALIIYSNSREEYFAVIPYNGTCFKLFDKSVITTGDMSKSYGESYDIGLGNIMSATLPRQNDENSVKFGCTSNSIAGDDGDDIALWSLLLEGQLAIAINEPIDYDNTHDMDLISDFCCDVFNWISEKMEE